MPEGALASPSLLLNLRPIYFSFVLSDSGAPLSLLRRVLASEVLRLWLPDPQLNYCFAVCKLSHMMTIRGFLFHSP